MIDEKKLIEDMLNNDGIDFRMDFNTDTEDSALESLREFADKFRQGMIELVQKQPKVGEWIPYDQLPKESGDYLVWYDNGDDEEGCIVMNFDAGICDFGYWCDEYDRDTLGFLDSEFIYFESAVAWMPLPEPYK